jgi:hypothetical protein
MNSNVSYPKLCKPYSDAQSALLLENISSSEAPSGKMTPKYDVRVKLKSQDQKSKFKANSTL